MEKIPLKNLEEFIHSVVSKLQEEIKRIDSND
jgi:hypothetical protein